jgi:hypothetical protein
MDKHERTVKKQTEKCGTGGLTMYEELIRDLRENHDKYFARDMQAADAIKELSAVCKKQEIELVELTGELASKPSWIPVTERLPEDLTRVIVFCEDGVSYGLCEHLIADDEEVVEWHDFLHYPITPTHWMPLPEPPKEET